MAGEAAGVVAAICEDLRRGQRFLVTSHARPDGDSIGSQVAIALALRHLGKHVRIVNRDAPPSAYLAFAGVGDIEVAASGEGEYDALLGVEHLPPTLSAHGRDRSAEAVLEGFSLKAAQRVVENKLIRQALEKTRGNRSQAARLLEISHPSLLSKIKAYHIGN